MEFEWDNNKNETNKKKHKIDFETAKNIFADPNRIIVESPQNNEMRYFTIGLILDLTYSVVYVIRNSVHRIISARKASRVERKRYFEKNYKI